MAVVKKRIKKAKPIEADFVGFNLAKYTLEQNIDEFTDIQKLRLSFEWNNNITIHLIEPLPKDKKPRVTVNIEVTVDGNNNDSVRPVFAKVQGVYIGKFYLTPVTMDAAKEFISLRENQKFLVYQVAPLAFAHMRAQLQLTGVSSPVASMPFSL